MIRKRRETLTVFIVICECSIAILVFAWNRIHYRSRQQGLSAKIGSSDHDPRRKNLVLGLCERAIALRGLFCEAGPSGDLRKHSIRCGFEPGRKSSPQTLYLVLAPQPRSGDFALCFGIAVIVTLLCIFALPPVISELQQFVTQLPELLDKLRTRFRSTPVLRSLDVGTVSSYVGSHVGKIASLFAGFAGAIVSLMTASILTAYLILDGKRVLSWFMSLFPVESRNRLETVLHRAGERMRKWLWGQAILMLILGSASFITFGSMGLRFFYLLALFAGLANIIPLLGPIATVIVAALIAAIDSPWKVLAY